MCVSSQLRRVMDSSEIDLNEIRAMLEAERSELLASQDARADESKPVALDQQSVGRLSRMDAIQVQSMAKALGAKRRIRLQRIEAALHRLEDGEYGYCAQCGEDIPLKRLEVDPATERCVGCAS